MIFVNSGLAIKSCIELIDTILLICLPTAQLLDTACKVVPLVVTISGRVGSETPISCEHSGLRGVIVEETVHGLFAQYF